MTRTPFVFVIPLTFFAVGCSQQSRQPPTQAIFVPQSAPAQQIPMQGMPPGAPPDRLVNLTRDLQAQADALSRKARQQLPQVRQRFLNGLPKGQHMFIMTEIHNDKGQHENAFVAVMKWEKGRVTGAVASDMIYVTNVKFGDAITVPESSITDWMISWPDGHEEGNAVGKFMDANGSALQR